MSGQGTLFRTPAGEHTPRWEISDLPGGQLGGASGWVDVDRGVGRIESCGSGDGPDRRRALLDELGRRYPGVRWFEDRAG